MMGVRKKIGGSISGGRNRIFSFLLLFSFLFSSLFLRIQDYFSVRPSRIIISLRYATFSTHSSFSNPITNIPNCKTPLTCFLTQFIVISSLFKIQVFPVLILLLRQDGVWGIRRTASLILNLSTRWR